MAHNSHQRDANARRSMSRPVTIAGSLALLATASAVSLGVVNADPATSVVASDVASPASSGALAAGGAAAELGFGGRERTLEPLSRSAVRGTTIEEKPTVVEKTMAPSAVQQAVASAGAEDKRYPTTLLNLWGGPSGAAENLGTVESSEPVRVTGRTLLGRTEVVLDGEARWVTSGYLADDKPEPAASGGGSSEASGSGAAAAVGTASCTNGSSVPSGVSPNIVAVHEAVCAAFPEITTYGTFRDDGEHAQGLAVDIMVSGSRGYEVAEFVKANYAELGVNYIIYSQQIWSVDRGSEGWRGMEDRGSTTANHYDHVHVTTY